MYISFKIMKSKKLKKGIGYDIMKNSKGLVCIIPGLIIQIYLLICSLINAITVTAYHFHKWSGLKNMSVAWFFFFLLAIGFFVSSLGAYKIYTIVSKGWSKWFIVYGLIFCLLSIIENNYVGMFVGLLYLVGGSINLSDPIR